jgi:hypothetical protein
LQTLEKSYFGDSNNHLWNSCCFFALFGTGNVRIFDMQNPLPLPHFRSLDRLKKTLGNGAPRSGRNIVCNRLGDYNEKMRVDAARFRGGLFDRKSRIRG